MDAFATSTRVSGASIAALTTFSGTFSGTVSGTIVSGTVSFGMVRSSSAVDSPSPASRVSGTPVASAVASSRSALRSFVSFFVPVVKPGPALNMSPSSPSEICVGGVGQVAPCARGSPGSHT